VNSGDALKRELEQGNHKKGGREEKLEKVGNLDSPQQVKTGNYKLIKNKKLALASTQT